MSGIEKSFHVATFNVRTSGALNDGRNMWWLRRKSALRTIKNFKAEIIALQEVRPNQLKYFRKRLSDYDVFSAGREDGSRGEHVPIFLNPKRFDVQDWKVLWLSPSPLVPGTSYKGAQFPRIVTVIDCVDRVSGTELRITNVHLDHNSDNARRLSVEQIAGLVDAVDCPVIVLGDFNCDIDDPVLKPLWDRGFNDVLKGIPARGSNAATHHSFTGAVDGNRIDHVLVSNDLETKQAGIVFDRPKGRLPSDHWPVVAELVTTDK